MTWENTLELFPQIVALILLMIGYLGQSALKRGAYDLGKFAKKGGANEKAVTETSRHLANSLLCSSSFAAVWATTVLNATIKLGLPSQASAYWTVTLISSVIAALIVFGLIFGKQVHKISMERISLRFGTKGVVALRFSATDVISVLTIVLALLSLVSGVAQLQ